MGWLGLQNPVRSRAQASVVGAEPQPGALQVRLQHRAHPLRAKPRLTPLSRAGDTPTCLPHHPRGEEICCRQHPTRSRPGWKCRSLVIPRRGRDRRSRLRYKTPWRGGKRRQRNKARDLTPAELSCRAPSHRLEKKGLETVPLVSHVLLATTGWAQCHGEVQHRGGEAEQGRWQQPKEFACRHGHVLPVSALQAPVRPAVTVPSCSHILSSQGRCQLLPSYAMPDRLRKPQMFFFCASPRKPKLRTELEPKAREKGTGTEQGPDRYKGGLVCWVTA